MRKHFNDFAYRQEKHANANLVNSETRPGSVSRTFKPIPYKFNNFFEKKIVMLTKEASS